MYICMVRSSGEARICWSFSLVVVGMYAETVILFVHVDNVFRRFCSPFRSPLASPHAPTQKSESREDDADKRDGGGGRRQ